MERDADRPSPTRSAPSRTRDGIVASLALVPSVFVYGTVFGGLAVQAGLRSIEVLGMSLLVFAGAAQFVAVPMIAAGTSPLAIVLTTYVVNMRHYLMAATLAPAFSTFPRAWLALVGAQLHGRADWLVALASGVLAVAIALVLPGNWHIILAGVAVSAVAALVLDPERA